MPIDSVYANPRETHLDRFGKFNLSLELLHVSSMLSVSSLRDQPGAEKKVFRPTVKRSFEEGKPNLADQSRRDGQSLRRVVVTGVDSIFDEWTLFEPRKVGSIVVPIQEKDMVGVDGSDLWCDSGVKVQETRVLLIGRLVQDVVAGYPCMVFVSLHLASCELVRLTCAICFHRFTVRS